MSQKKKQHGVVLWVALVVLAIMMAATVAILRNTSAGQNIAGNLGFKQNAETVGDQGAEAALAWISNPARTWALLGADSPADGYYATWNGGTSPSGTTFDPLNPSVFDWSVSAVQSTADDGTRNEVRYVIHRMCSSPGSVTAPGQECSFPPPNPDGCKGHDCVGPTAIPETKPFYRVTVRITGPRDTVSYIQTMIYEE